HRAGPASHLHYYWHDHRPPARALAHEPPHLPAHLLLQQLHVAGPGRECRFDGVGHPRLAFVEEGVRLGPVHPAARDELPPRVPPPAADDLGPGDPLARQLVDRAAPADAAFVGEPLPIAQHTAADVVYDAVDVQQAGRHPAAEAHAVVADGDGVAVGAIEDMV